MEKKKKIIKKEEKRGKMCLEIDYEEGFISEREMERIDGDEGLYLDNFSDPFLEQPILN